VIWRKDTSCVIMTCSRCIHKESGWRVGFRLKIYLVVTMVTLIVIVVALSLGLLWNQPEKPEPIGIQFGDEVCVVGIGMVQGMPYPDTMIICGELKPKPVKKIEGETGL